MSTPSATVQTTKQPKSPPKSLEIIGLSLGLSAIALLLIGIYKRTISKTEEGKKPSLILSIITLICGLGSAIVGGYVYMQQRRVYLADKANNDKPQLTHLIFGIFGLVGIVPLASTLIAAHVKDNEKQSGFKFAGYGFGF